MSSLLPLFLNPQSSSPAAHGGKSSSEIFGQVSEGQGNAAGQTFAKAFSHVLREHGDTAAFLQNLHALISKQNQPGAVSSPPLLEKDVHHLEGLVGSETIEKFLGKLQVSKGEGSPEKFFRSALGSDGLLDLAKLLPEQSVPIPVVSPTESVPTQVQDFSIDEASVPGRLPTNPLSSLQGLQSSPNTVLQENRFQQTGGDFILKPVRQEPVIDGKISGNSPIPLPKAFEAGSVLSQGSVSKMAELRAIPQEVSQTAASNPASSGSKPEEALPVRTISQSAKDVVNGSPQLVRPIVENETRQTPILHKFSSPLGQASHGQTQPISPVAVIPAEGPAGFAGSNVTNQISVKTVSGNSSVGSEVPGSGIEHRTTVSVDLLGEIGLAKGDRSQAVAEVSGKAVSVDTSGGHGLGNGMNQFNNSQSGFQQSSLLSGQGIGLRPLEERGQEFPTPLLQRLQLDVQVSENQRVQIDVGVQNRQVYAGLVMDHSVLRNLANQFVPQLENQLADVDLELQEFSAEVREEGEQQPHMFEDSRSHEGPMFGRDGENEILATRNQLGRQKEQGLHLVA